MTKKKILIVEDELITAADIKFTLKDSGFEVVGTTATGQNAIDISKEKHPDLVLMDLHLKGKMNGLEAAKEILKSDTKVIFLTGQANQEELDQTTANGASGYITKPFDHRKLKKAVQDALGIDSSDYNEITPNIINKEPKIKVEKSVEKKQKEDSEDDLKFNKSQYILVVEDEMITALDIKLKLEDFGYNVIKTVKSGEEAIEVVKNNALDLILMDITLKGDINGIETTRRIKKDYDIPVIYLTANTNKESIEQAINTKPEGYIPKPFDVMELKHTVGVALRKYKSQYSD